MGERERLLEAWPRVRVGAATATYRAFSPAAESAAPALIDAIAFSTFDASRSSSTTRSVTDSRADASDACAMIDWDFFYLDEKKCRIEKEK